MKRIVLSFPFAIVTFLIGLAGFSLAISILDWDPWPAFEVPFMVHEQRSDQTSTAYITSSEEQMSREVYMAVLETEGLGTGPIVLQEYTTRGGFLMEDPLAKEYLGAVQDSTLVSYELRNREPRGLKEVLRDRSDITFYTDKDDMAIVLDRREPYEDRFEQRFPGADRLLSVSNIGFNTDYTEAIVYFSYYCGSLCAEGSVIVLKRTRDRWVVDHKSVLWVS